MSTSRLLDRFRISVAMQPYVLRLRLRGWDFDFGSNPETAAAFTKCIGEMRRILVEKRHIPVVAADRAILKTLEAAVDFQLAELRSRSLKVLEDQAQDTLDRLIKCVQRLGNAIAQLPPTSKGELNKQASAILGRTTFDTEVFIEIIETITATLPSLSPQVLAESVLTIIHPEPGEGRRPPLIHQWETMPAITRVKVEDIVQHAKLPTSLAEWLNRLGDLVDQERPARKQGAPSSATQVFVQRVAAIWGGLGLDVGLAYDFLHRRSGDEVGRGRHVESRFQRYCHAALSAVGDSTKVSARQVVNYKKKQGSKS
jgi:hypothetical protein